MCKRHNTMRQLITFLFLIILCSACYEDYDNSIITEDKNMPETTMESGLTGRAYGNDGTELSSYTLRVNDQEYNYENFHYQYILDLRKFGQVTFLINDQEVIGFSNNLLLENDINSVDITAFPDKKQSIIVAEKEIIEIDSDLTITIDRQQLLDQQNQLPQSDIVVSHLSTDNQKILSQVGHFGYDDTQNLLVLNPIKLFMIEISSGGNKLLIDTDNPLSLDVNNSSASLFYMNVNGYWTELQNNTQVSQTGYYLIADASPGLYNEGTITKSDKPVSYIDMDYKHDVDSKSYSTKSTSLGKWAVVSYLDESLKIDYTTPCGDRIDASVIATTDVSQLDIVDEIESDIHILEVTTQVIDCNGDISELPTINVQSDNKSFIYPYSANNIDTWIAVCQDKVDVTGFNILDKQEGPLLDWSIDIEDAISYLSYCDNYKDGFSYIKIRDDAMVYDSPNLELDGNKTKLMEKDNRFRMNFDGMNLGIYGVEDVRIFLEDRNFGSKGYRITCEDSPQGCGIGDFSVTHYDSTNAGWTRISFSGTIWMQTIDPPLVGDFKVEGVILRR